MKVPIAPHADCRSQRVSNWLFHSCLRFLADLSVGDNVRVHRISSSGTMHHVLWSARGKRTGKEETKMSAEENKAVVRREQEELWNHTGDLDAAEELYAAGQAEAAKQEAANFRQGFPDVISTIEDLIAEGDMVVARWRSRATHQGKYMGIAPTGKEVKFTGISFYRVEGGKIAQSWNIEDQLGLMRQIGVVPEPGQSEEASPT